MVLQKAALVLDFDWTLSEGIMHDPFLQERGIKPSDFWQEIATLEDIATGAYGLAPAQKFVELARDRPGHPLAGLNNAQLRESGELLTPYTGLPEFFPRIKEEAKEKYQLDLEIHIVTTGFAIVVEGSPMYCNEIDSITGVRFSEKDGIIYQPTNIMGPAQKVLAIRRISLGENYTQIMDLFQYEHVEPSRIEIPLQRMCYVGDGDTDSMAMDFLAKHQGARIAVYDPQVERKITIAKNLVTKGYACSVAPADYRPGSEFCQILDEKLQRMAR